MAKIYTPSSLDLNLSLVKVTVKRCTRHIASSKMLVLQLELLFSGTI